MWNATEEKKCKKGNNCRKHHQKVSIEHLQYTGAGSMRRQILHRGVSCQQEKHALELAMNLSVHTTISNILTAQTISYIYYHTTYVLILSLLFCWPL